MKRLFTSEVPARRHHFACCWRLALRLRKTRQRRSPRSSATHSHLEGRAHGGTRTSSGALARVTTARVDTVTVYKTDTLRTTTQLPGRVDTVRMTNTVTRVDTVSLQPPPRVVQLPERLYFGLGRRSECAERRPVQPQRPGPVSSGATWLAGTRQSPSAFAPT